MVSIIVKEVKNLPIELWTEIIANILELVGMRKAVQLRLVNKMFAAQIILAIRHSYFYHKNGAVKLELCRRAKHGLPLPQKMMGTLLLMEMEYNPTHNHLFPIWDQIKNREKATCEGKVERLQNRRIICEAISERQFWTWQCYKLGFRCERHFAGFVQTRKPAVDDRALTHIALSVAIVARDFNSVKELLFKSPNVDAENEFFGRPLQLAAKWSSIEIVEQLLEAGVDIHAHQRIHRRVSRWLDWLHRLYNISCGSALEVACLAGREDIVKLLIRHWGRELSEEDYTRAIESAARGGHASIVASFIERLNSGVVSLPSDIPRRVFLLASYNGHEEVVRMMLNERVDANTLHTERKCLAAIQLANKNGHNRVVRLLLEHGATLNNC